MLRGTCYLITEDGSVNRSTTIKVITVPEAETVEAFQTAAALLLKPRNGSIEYGPIGPPWWLDNARKAGRAIGGDRQLGE